MLLKGAELGTAQPRKNILLLLLLSYSEKSPKANCLILSGALNLEQSCGTGVKYLFLLLCVTMQFKK